MDLSTTPEALDARPFDSFPAFHGTRSYPEPDHSSPHHPIPLLQDPS
jgi:hypothetical protein